MRAPILLFLLFFALKLTAQEEKTKEDKYYMNNLDRKWVLEIPLWIPGFRGEFSFGDVNMSSSEGERQEKERLENSLGIEFYFVGRASYVSNRFIANMDVFSGTINTKLKFNGIVNKDVNLVNLTLSASIPRIYAGYSVWKKSNDVDFELELVPYLGLRYFHVQLNSIVLDSIYSSSVRPDWFEPIVGFQIASYYKRFLFSYSADIGAASGQTTWMMNFQAQYRISKLIHLKLGWNHLTLNHKYVIDDTDLDLKIVLTGPALGVGFRF